MSNKFHTLFRAAMPVTLFLLLASGLCAQQAPTLDASAGPFPDAPSVVQEQEQQPSSQVGAAQPQTPGPDAKLGESSVPEQNSASTPPALEQPKRILYVIPNYRAVSADANVPPLDATGKFKLFVEDSFDYSTFVYVGFLSGIGMAQKSVPPV